MGSATHFVYRSGPSGYSETRCWCYASSDHVVGKEQLRYDDGSIRSVDTCPEWNCPDLSAEDRREGKKCLDHPCHCVTVESVDRGSDGA